MGILLPISPLNENIYPVKTRVCEINFDWKIVQRLPSSVQFFENIISDSVMVSLNG